MRPRSGPCARLLADLQHVIIGADLQPDLLAYVLDLFCPYRVAVLSFECRYHDLNKLSRAIIYGLFPLFAVLFAFGFGHFFKLGRSGVLASKLLKHGLAWLCPKSPISHQIETS